MRVREERKSRADEEEEGDEEEGEGEGEEEARGRQEEGAGVWGAALCTGGCKGVGQSERSRAAACQVPERARNTAAASLRVAVSTTARRTVVMHWSTVGRSGAGTKTRRPADGWAPRTSLRAKSVETAARSLLGVSKASTREGFSGASVEMARERSGARAASGVSGI